ncbi:M60 family metallopeptidase [Antarcticibacterium sp. 1MA-6-2]|uniref:M60 family metallopeptidase n=1 Tax=Antarcticibacterium sp. 1MA-6-2 TaxID=2908210 RepID=UPI002104A51D|nr:M60 family metallopeptidase [Antarcticibacterium sp. 1MA-6-2]
MKKLLQKFWLLSKDHPSHNDVFVKLVPFWQLELYVSNVLGQKDFYKDLHEVIRNSENEPTNGHHQLEFVKIASDVA